MVGGLPPGLPVLLAPPLRGYMGKRGISPHDRPCRLAPAVHGVCPATAGTKVPRPPGYLQRHGSSWRRWSTLLELLHLTGLARYSTRATKAPQRLYRPRSCRGALDARSRLCRVIEHPRRLGLRGPGPKPRGSLGTFHPWKVPRRRPTQTDLGVSSVSGQHFVKRKAATPL